MSQDNPVGVQNIQAGDAMQDFKYLEKINKKSIYLK